MVPNADVDVEKRPSMSLAHDLVASHEQRNTTTSSSAAVDETPVPPVVDDDDDEFNPPDGGWRAWSQVLAAHLINAMTWGYAATFGVYQLHYVDTMALPAAQVSWIGSVQIFLTFATCAVSGRLSDAGYARETAAGGCFLAVLGTFMTSLATTYWQIFLAQGVCTGLGLGIAFMPALSVTSSYFKHNRSFALAVAAVGTSVGSLIFPSSVQYLTPQIGFPWAVRCAAFVALLVCAVACMLLKPYLPARKAGPWVEWEAFRELPYVLFALGSFLNFYAMYFGFFYVSNLPRVPERFDQGKRQLTFTRSTATPVTSSASRPSTPSTSY